MYVDECTQSTHFVLLTNITQTKPIHSAYKREFIITLDFTHVCLWMVQTSLVAESHKWPQWANHSAAICENVLWCVTPRKLMRAKIRHLCTHVKVIVTKTKVSVSDFWLGISMWDQWNLIIHKPKPHSITTLRHSLQAKRFGDWSQTHTKSSLLRFSMSTCETRETCVQCNIHTTSACKDWKTLKNSSKNYCICSRRYYYIFDMLMRSVKKFNSRKCLIMSCV